MGDGTGRDDYQRWHLDQPLPDGCAGFGRECSAVFFVIRIKPLHGLDVRLYVGAAVVDERFPDDIQLGNEGCRGFESGVLTRPLQSMYSTLAKAVAA